jgi:hypothetical protein
VHHFRPDFGLTIHPDHWRWAEHEHANMRAAATGAKDTGSKSARSVVAVTTEPGFRHLVFDPTQSKSHSPATATRSNRFELPPAIFPSVESDRACRA